MMGMSAQLFVMGNSITIDRSQPSPPPFYANAQLIQPIQTLESNMTVSSNEKSDTFHFQISDLDIEEISCQ